MVWGRRAFRVSATFVRAAITVVLSEIGFVVVKMWFRRAVLLVTSSRGDIISGYFRYAISLDRANNSP